MAGALLTAVSKNLGHTKTEISERYYAHLSSSYLRAEICNHMPKLNLGGGIALLQLKAATSHLNRMTPFVSHRLSRSPYHPIYNKDVALALHLIEASF